jgi:hypothetical protein
MATLVTTPIKTFVSGETVTPTKLNELSQSTVALTAGTIVAADIASDAVTTAKILDANVTTAKLADSAVTQAKLASNVTTTGPAFRAHATAATSVSHNTPTKIALATENFDTANCFASSTFTPNVAGYYQFSFAVRFEAATSSQALLYKNGSLITQGSFVAVANSYTSAGSDLVYMNGTTDYVDLYAYQATGVAQNASTGSAATFLSGFLARAA